MSVYVDALREAVAKEAQARRVGARNGHRWCHMVADSLAELHAMANKIGLKREWLQTPDIRPHYDLTPSRRERAVALGAKEVEGRDVARVLIRWREGGRP